MLAHLSDGKRASAFPLTDEEAEMIAERLTEEALDEISAFANAERLVALGAYLAVRKH